MLQRYTFFVKQTSRKGQKLHFLKVKTCYLQRVNVIVYLQRSVTLVLSQLLLRKVEVLSDTLYVKIVF